MGREDQLLQLGLQPGHPGLLGGQRCLSCLQHTGDPRGAGEVPRQDRVCAEGRARLVGVGQPWETLSPRAGETLSARAGAGALGAPPLLPQLPPGDAAKLGFSVYHLPHVAVTRTHI